MARAPSQLQCRAYSDIKVLWKRKEREVVGGGMIWTGIADYDLMAITEDVKRAARRGGYGHVPKNDIKHFTDGIFLMEESISDFNDRFRSLYLGILLYPQYEGMDIKPLYAKEVIKGKMMIPAMIINMFPKDAQILLNFLYEYLKCNPNHIFVPRLHDWYFSYEDIVEIREKEFDMYWMHKNPHMENVKYGSRYIEINGHRRDFECKIIQIDKYKKKYIVRQEIRYDIGLRLSNMYGLDENANIVWELENLYENCPRANIDGISDTTIEDDILIARDGWNEYYINMETGKVEKYFKQPEEE